MIISKNNVGKICASLLILFFLVGSSLNVTTPVAAKEPIDTQQEPTDLIVPPLIDISKAMPADPMENINNPKSPQYDPNAQYGPAGTRFGPPGKRGADISLLAPATVSPLTTDHQYWGTTFVNTPTTTYGVYAYQFVSTTLAVNNNDILYAPTMACPNDCPLEMTTEYTDQNNTMYRQVRVWDFTLGGFEWTTNIDSTFCSKYVNDNYYIAEILYISPYWYACLYNWNTLEWDYVYYQSNLPGEQNSWSMWEEYNMSSSWPTLPQIYSKWMEVDLNGVWTPVGTTYGQSLISSPFNAPYSKGWTTQYSWWWIGS